MSATWPPGLSTRAISGSATSWSNQWNACATTTTSTERSLAGMSSAVADLGAHLGHALAQHLEHRLVGVGREDRVARVDELAGQLARSGAELEDDLGLAAGEPGDGFGSGYAGRPRS